MADTEYCEAMFNKLSQPRMEISGSQAVSGPIMLQWNLVYVAT